MIGPVLKGPKEEDDKEEIKMKYQVIFCQGSYSQVDFETEDYE